MTRADRTDGVLRLTLPAEFPREAPALVDLTTGHDLIQRWNISGLDLRVRAGEIAHLTVEVEDPSVVADARAVFQTPLTVDALRGLRTDLLEAVRLAAAVRTEMSAARRAGDLHAGHPEVTERIGLLEGRLTEHADTLDAVLARVEQFLGGDS